MKINCHIILDVTKQGVQVTVPITQHDAGSHRLIMTLRNNDQTVALSPTDHAALYLPEGDVWDPVTVYTAESAFPNSLVYDLSAAVSSAEGVHRAVVTLTDGKGSVLYTPELAFAVRPDLTGGTAVLESAPYAAVILAQGDAEASAGEAESYAAAAKSSAEAAAHSAEQAEKEAAEAAKAAVEAAGEELKGELRQIQSEIQEEMSGYVNDGELSVYVDSQIESRYAEIHDRVDAKLASVDTELSRATSVLVVPSLPTVGVENKLYLVPAPEAGESDLYEEYLWVNGGTEEEPSYGWEYVSSKKLDLSEYVKKTDYATSDTPGVIAVPGGYGIGIKDTKFGVKTLYMMQASNEEIEEASNPHKPIMVTNVEHAVSYHGGKYFADRETQTALERKVSELKRQVTNLVASAEGILYVTEEQTLTELMAQAHRTDDTLLWLNNGWEKILPVAVLSGMTLTSADQVPDTLFGVDVSTRMAAVKEKLAAQGGEAVVDFESGTVTYKYLSNECESISLTFDRLEYEDNGDGTYTFRVCYKEKDVKAEELVVDYVFNENSETLSDYSFSNVDGTLVGEFPLACADETEAVAIAEQIPNWSYDVYRQLYATATESLGTVDPYVTLWSEGDIQTNETYGTYIDMGAKIDGAEPDTMILKAMRKVEA